MSHREVGVRRKRAGWMEFTFIASSLRCPQTKSIPVIFGKEGSAKESIIKAKGNLPEDKRLLSDYSTHDPVFSTYTQKRCLLFQDEDFSSPSWDSDDASLIEPNSSPKRSLINCWVPQGASITLWNTVLQTQSILWCCIMAKLRMWTSHTYNKNLSLATGLLGCGFELTIKLSARNTLSLWKHEIYGE